MACSMNYLGTVGMYAVSLSFKKSPMDIIGLGLTYDFKIKAAVRYYILRKYRGVCGGSPWCAFCKKINAWPQSKQ